MVFRPHTVTSREEVIRGHLDSIPVKVDPQNSASQIEIGSTRCLYPESQNFQSGKMSFADQEVSTHREGFGEAIAAFVMQQWGGDLDALILAKFVLPRLVAPSIMELESMSQLRSSMVISIWH